MKTSNHLPHLKGFRHPREIIVWAYHRFALSTADVEDLLAERGIIVSREAIRLWVNRFGCHFAKCIRRDRPRPNDKWHLDEALPGNGLHANHERVVITIRGKKHWLWRAIDANGDVLDINGANPPKRKSCKVVISTLDLPVWRTTCGYHRQITQRHKARQLTSA